MKERSVPFFIMILTAMAPFFTLQEIFRRLTREDVPSDLRETASRIYAEQVGARTFRAAMLRASEEEPRMSKQVLVELATIRASEMTIVARMLWERIRGEIRSRLVELVEKTLSAMNQFFTVTLIAAVMMLVVAMIGGGDPVSFLPIYMSLLLLFTIYMAYTLSTHAFYIRPACATRMAAIVAGISAIAAVAVYIASRSPVFSSAAALLTATAVAYLLPCETAIDVIEAFKTLMSEVHDALSLSRPLVPFLATYRPRSETVKRFVGDVYSHLVFSTDARYGYPLNYMFFLFDIFASTSVAAETVAQVVSILDGVAEVLREEKTRSALFPLLKTAGDAAMILSLYIIVKVFSTIKVQNAAALGFAMASLSFSTFSLFAAAVAILSLASLLIFPLFTPMSFKSALTPLVAEAVLLILLGVVG